MRRLATAAPPPTAAKLHLWNSPIPYLFGGLFLTMLLIAVALIILACSFRKRFFTGHSSPGSQKDPPVAGSAAMEPVMEPKILVVMAGNNTPTFLATPAAAALGNVPRRCSCTAIQQDDKQNHSAA
ncbi:protein GLUTAMINE DUMPER 6-like [Cucurbita moschata]|uniref:Protein GLUTAMINE DUMPER 6-like n=1 Tax=Cucurbita moschata TaxID=3662 RepID=A0A6J1GBQ1_CUCMO|nr:protein GLUTAMINE DUMPER 6-like [Cucurbita moschata]